MLGVIMKGRCIFVLIFFSGISLFFSACGIKKITSGLGMEVAREAHKYIGVPYKYGGRSPNGFDCSGLVWYIYKQHGVSLPDASYKQASSGVKVKRGDLVPGDLIFFQTNGRIHHVGLYVGGNKMIHAPGMGKSVVKTSLKDKYYRTHYATSRRVVN
jgi:cell wall-associated NlpC family hydrolase